MTKESSWYGGLESTAASEADIIVREFRDVRGIEIGGVSDPEDPGYRDRDVTPNGIAFMYAQDHILTREQYLGDAGGVQEVQGATRPRGVLDILRENGFQDRDIRVSRVVRDVVLIRLNGDRRKDTRESNEEARESSDSTTESDEENLKGNDRPSGGGGGTGEGNGEIAEGDQPDVIFLLNRIDEELGVGIATPDQVLTAANGSLSPCSATEPQPVYPPVELNPARCAGNGGARVRIFLADTGLLPDAAEKFDWLHGVDGEKDLRTGAGGTIVPYEGHGTFVAGVLRCVAPEAEVYVANIFNTAGSALESDFVLRLNAAFGFGFEILHLTASCMTRKNVQLIALEAWLEQLQSYKGVVCIAPAGNNHTRRPSWPGALPGVISVGALAADLHSRAQFSDYGSWVNVYAPGENLINAFASGTYTCEIPPFVGQQRTFSGRALWSGTSFSAPIVTGLIAARMARRGESGKEAVAALLDRARAQTIPGVGPVLLPCCDDEDGNCGGHDCGGCVDCGCGRGDCDGCGGHGHRSRGHCGCGRCGHDKPGGRRW